ncbi:MAG: glycerophosphodiester phosphodiesterase [Sphingomonadaceae bacterium]|nr:glycerophosphodiester phosphodiesterase [Sphingomonadaceae bacterium]
MQRRPIVIAHRGASGERPEHTLAAYELAIEQRADFIEPDLVMTSDGVLVARHEPYLGGDNPDFAGADTTDVAGHPNFAGRKRTVTIDGVRLTGWFACDFTLTELKTLRARERLPQLRPGNTAYDGRFEVPTLAEIIALARAAEARTGRAIGIYPETKHPSWHASLGLPMEAALVRQLHAAGYDRQRERVFIQSFEVGNLNALRAMTPIPLVQLMGDDTEQPADFAIAGDHRTYADLATPEGLRAVAAYATAVGPSKARVLAVGSDGTPRDTGFARAAHAAGLKVHPWTFRAENQFLPPALRRGTDPAAHGDLTAELQAAFAAGVDGVFADFPATAVAARDQALQSVG